MTVPALASETPTRAISSRPWLPILLALACAVLFFFANRAAYKGYFSDDDFDNIGWPTFVGNDVYYEALLSPQFSDVNFRPVGFLYYRLVANRYHLRYRAYVVVIQLLHVLNIVLLYILMRRLNLSRYAAGIGALFYSFHAAVIEAYWKPMFVFDVLCCTFCLLTLLLYVRGRWMLALLTFWLAYKAKEIAVMLPIALLAWEIWLAPKPVVKAEPAEPGFWRRVLERLIVVVASPLVRPLLRTYFRTGVRLALFFAISLNFGLQALLHNKTVGVKNPYSLSFEPGFIWHSIQFYSSWILFIPFAGLALFALPFLVRDRRVYLGITMMTAIFIPLLALHGRLESVYWYLPLAGLAIVVAAIAPRIPRWAVIVFFLLWLPLNYVMLRDKRKEILMLAHESRGFMTGLLNYAKHVPQLKAVVYESAPAHMHSWGAEGAIHLAFGHQVEVAWHQFPEAVKAMQTYPMAIIHFYDPDIIKGIVRKNAELQSRISFTNLTPKSQFGSGWYIWEKDSGPVRWASPEADATLYRPPKATAFEIDCSVPQRNLEEGGPSQVTVLEDHRSLGVQTLSAVSGQILHWSLPAGAAGNHTLTIRSQPVRHGPGDTRDYGIAIRSFGYVVP